MTARLTNVIIIESGSEECYFTLQGIAIGILKGGARLEPKEPKPTAEIKGGVVGSQTPEEIEQETERETESIIDKMRKHGEEEK